jgi:hypothetical protein
LTGIRLHREGDGDADKYSAILILAKIQLSPEQLGRPKVGAAERRKFLRAIALLGQEK